MAEESIIIDVQVNTEEVAKKIGDATNNIRMIKSAQKDLEKALKEGTISSEEYGKAIAANKSNLEKYQRELKSSTAAMQAAGTQTVTTSQSLDEQRQILNGLQKMYGMLSGDAKKAADAEGGLRDQIDKLSDAVKEQEAAIGDNRRNVGNYAGAMTDAFESLGKAAGDLSPTVSVLRSMGGEGKRLGDILDTIGKAMQIASKAGKAMTTATAAQQTATKGATTAQIGLNTAMAANPIGLIVAAVSTLLPLIQTFISSYSDATEQTEALNRALEREQAIISRMETDTTRAAKFAEAEGASAEEVLAIRRDAAKKELEIADARVDELMRLRLEGNKKEKIAAKEAMADALATQKEAYDRLQALNDEATTSLVKTRRKAAEDNKAAMMEEAEEQRKLNAITEEFLKTSTEYSVAEEARQSKTKELQEELASLRDAEEELVEPLTYYQQVILECMQAGDDFATAQIRAAALVRSEWTGAAGQIAGGFANAFGAMSDMLGEYSEESAEAAVAAKAFGMAGVLASEAETIANGVKGVSAAVAAGAGLIFPANLPAIAMGVAAVTSTIAGVITGITQAKQILSLDAGKFANGGVVGGNSYTGDKLIAHVNSGEGIYTPTQANAILQEIANNPARGGVDYGAMADALAAAVAAQPAPVVVYSELQEFGQKITNYQEIARV